MGLLRPLGPEDAGQIYALRGGAAVQEYEASQRQLRQRLYRCKAISQPGTTLRNTSPAANFQKRLNR